jgi:hypothetical protein
VTSQHPKCDRDDISRDVVLPDEMTDAANVFHWSSLLSWGVFLGLGLLVWELTDQSGIAVSVACLKFGLDETATGLYLLRHDPNPSRGWSAFVFHLARGCGRFGLIGYLTSSVVVFVQEHVHQWQGKPFVAAPGDDLLLNVGILGLCGISLWPLFSGGATWYAWKTRVRLWIDPTTRESRKVRIWPPQPRGRNRVWLSAIIGTATASHMLGLQALAIASNGWSLLATIPATLALGWWVARRIAARTPEECWPPDESAKFPVWATDMDSDDELALADESSADEREPD